MALTSPEVLPTVPAVPAQTLSSSCSNKRRRNRKKRKKSGGDHAPSQINNDSPIGDGDSARGNGILRSKLSLKKRLFLKKSADRTPWYDADELLEIGRGLLLASKLFPSRHHYQNGDPSDGTSSLRTPLPAVLAADELDRLRASLRRVALWRGRSDRGGRLPHAIDSTAGLAGILLTDAERCLGASSAPEVTAIGMANGANVVGRAPSPHDLRNAYSSLLLRSVNGLADAYRHQRKSAALSVSHCCALAGLPLWIVDARHDAAHGELPSLGVCRVAAIEALGFWGGRYWDSLEKAVRGSSGGRSTHKLGADGTSLLDEAGIRTLALDCLVRYRNAATAEACRDKGELMKQQQQQQLTRTERGQRNQKVGSPDITEDDRFSTAVQESIDDATDLNGKTAEVEDLVHISLENDSKSKLKRGKSNDEQNRLDRNGNLDHQSRGAIPWWILNDDKPKKKRKKAKTNDTVPEGNETTDAPKATDSKSYTPPDAGTVNGAQSFSATGDEESASVPSSRDCAAEFVRRTPMDVAFSAALRFLVWGDSSPHDANGIKTDNCRNGEESDTTGRIRSDGPALLTLLGFDLPAESPLEEQCWQPPRQELDAAFERLHAMYNPLLIALTNAYPGFLVALFVHLVDSVLCLDAARRSQLGSENAACDELMLDLKQLDLNVQCLSRWLRYVLSRECHMHFDRSVAMYDKSVMSQSTVDKPIMQAKSPPDRAVTSERKQLPSRLVDLKKKGRKKWTLAELEYMQTPLEYLSLREIGFPLNSVCDRLHSHICDFSPVCTSGSDVANSVSAVELLRQLLEDIMGEERVPFMDLHNHEGIDKSSHRNNCPMTKESVAGGDVRDTRESAAVPDQVPENDAPKDVSKASQSNSLCTTNILSLEDMEAMLGNADANTDTNAASMCSPDREKGGHCIEDGSEKASLRVMPW
eukprot:CAMPEP_0172530004 /NCGR_PEP_ID=MMETSP1067-20121228/3897_1 /TAXON_ID=265564 ORGANISM="Thalassiosira punctigera, Strain Tpunct2005C2" /NCGR_SAMPLE_ID=MMETSP1067 /ASSEMBLY_ACC=CAM_ASM_000444 /LENGTH=928 /DNA_ID=CAMNT_0013314147 /DNA_START=96 /DNA_END=2879 /DNA_ORIENTATION=-